jgi:hypothetical protein
MDIKRITIDTSPSNAAYARLSADVTYEHSYPHACTFWFEVPSEYGDALSNSGNTWLAAMLPVAMSLNEPLRIDAPVDGKLLTNQLRLQSIWRGWYPYLHQVTVEADVYNEITSAPNPSLNASFFSGGVDSCYTMLSHAAKIHGQNSLDIHEFLFISGFDIGLNETTALQWVSDYLNRLADSLEKKLIFVTWGDLRAARYFKVTDWGHISHGAMLSATALAMENRYKGAMIPSSWTDQEMIHWGTHPETDPLYSTSQLRIMHDTTAISRTDKIEFIAQFDAVLESLRVCWDAIEGGNCSGCEKCFRTMLALDLCGALDRARTFDTTHWNISRIADLQFKKSHDFIFWRDLLAYARRKNRSDVVKLLEGKLRSGRAVEMSLKFIEHLNHYTAGRWLLRKRRNLIYKISRLTQPKPGL